MRQHALIYKPNKSAMQSGLRNTRRWVLEYEPGQARRPDPLMGWTSSADMLSQVRLKFDSRDEAVAYAERNRIPYKVLKEHQRKRRIQTYADNFK